jgi:hypothetical protein
MGTKADRDSSVDAGQRFDRFHDSYLADPYPFVRQGTGRHPGLLQSQPRLLGRHPPVPSAPGVAGVQVWEVMSRGWGPRTGRPLPEAMVPQGNLVQFPDSHSIPTSIPIEFPRIDVSGRTLGTR